MNGDIPLSNLKPHIPGRASKHWPLACHCPLLPESSWPLIRNRQSKFSGSVIWLDSLQPPACCSDGARSGGPRHTPACEQGHWAVEETPKILGQGLNLSLGCNTSGHCASLKSKFDKHTSSQNHFSLHIEQGNNSFSKWKFPSGKFLNGSFLKIRFTHNNLGHL